MDPALPELRLQVPCDDARDFHARLARLVAASGVRIRTERGLAESTRVAVVLELRDGSTLRSEGVVDAHLMDEGRSAVHVRLLSIERPAALADAARDDEPLVSRAIAPETIDADEPLVHPAAAPGCEEPPWVEAEELPAAAVLPGNVLGAGDGAPRELGGAFETSGEVLAAVRRGGDRAQRLAVALVALAFLVAAAGFALVRHLGAGASPRAAVVAHLDAADRLEADGRLAGDDGAIAELLAARRLAPADAAIDARLARIADRLELLGARALQRNDLVAAAFDLEAARLAAPDRPGLRAKLDELERRTRRAEARRKRAPADAAARR